MAGSGQRIFNDEKVTKSFHEIDQNGAEQTWGHSEPFPDPLTSSKTITTWIHQTIVIPLTLTLSTHKQYDLAVR